MKICKSCGCRFDGYNSQKFCDTCRTRRLSRPKRFFVEVGKTYDFFQINSMAERAYRCYNITCLKCGRNFVATGDAINKFSKSGCGTCRSEAKKSKRYDGYNNCIGAVFGQLEVTGWSPGGRRGAVMRCRCNLCGNETDIALKRLKDGSATKCLACAVSAFKKSGSDIVKLSAVDGTSVLQIDGRRSLNRNSSTCHAGVSMTRNGKYRAYITLRRKQYHLGTYENIDDAIAARKAGEKSLYGDFLSWYKENFPQQWEKLLATKKEN